VHETDVFTALSIRAARAVTGEDLTQHLRQRWSGGIDGEHAWISIEQLRTAGKPGEPEWNRQFDAMVAFARTRDWVSVDGELVRLHIQRP
jgi:hypothetical protein